MLCSNQYSMFFKTITNPNSGQLGQNLGIGTRTFHSKSTFFRVSLSPYCYCPCASFKVASICFQSLLSHCWPARSRRVVDRVKQHTVILNTNIVVSHCTGNFTASTVHQNGVLKGLNSFITLFWGISVKQFDIEPGRTVNLFHSCSCRSWCLPAPVHG